MNTYRVNSSILPRVAVAKGGTTHRRVDVFSIKPIVRRARDCVADTRAHYEFEPRRPRPNLPPLQIAVRLAPPVFIDNIGESDAANRTEPAHGVADRQQGIGVTSSSSNVDVELVWRKYRAMLDRFGILYNGR
jgi:hypothetical protein